MYVGLLVTRLLLAVLFFVAGIGKLFGGFANSRKALADFGVPQWLVVPSSIVLPWVELSTAGLLFPASSTRIGAVSALALLLIFNAAIAGNLALGRTPNCNCFGQLHSAPIGWRTLARNGVLIVLAGGIAWQAQHKQIPSLLQVIEGFNGKEISVAVVILLAFVAISVEALVLLQFFQQNGRLLLRIEALEAKLGAAKLAAPAVAPVPVPPRGLPIGSRAPSFELPNLSGGTATLERLLSADKPLVLIFSHPNCGPCNALMPDIAGWQNTLARDLNIVVVSEGRLDTNREKAAEHGVGNVLVEKKPKLAEQYHAYGTPTAVVVRSDGMIGSPAISGADAIRQLVMNKAWTEAGLAALMREFVQQPKPAPSRPALPVGSQAPAFSLPDLSGDTVDSVNFNGDGTLLLFWNPACGFCQQMLQQLKEWEKARPASALRLVLISGGSREANRDMGLESTILIDDKFAVGQLYGASGTPSGLLVDSNGKIASGLAVGASALMEILNGSRPASPAGQIAVTRPS
jgi:peroxiredoxin